jgi:hypothetical protein
MEHEACSAMLKLASLSACWRVRKSRVPKGDRPRRAWRTRSAPATSPGSCGAGCWTGTRPGSRPACRTGALAREQVPPARGDDVQPVARVVQHLGDAAAVERRRGSAKTLADVARRRRLAARAPARSPARCSRARGARRRPRSRPGRRSPCARRRWMRPPGAPAGSTAATSAEQKRSSGPRINPFGPPAAPGTTLMSCGRARAARCAAAPGDARHGS